MPTVAYTRVRACIRLCQSHMASAAEELTQTHAASITRASTLLVDDDVNNVRPPPTTPSYSTHFECLETEATTPTYVSFRFDWGIILSGCTYTEFSRKGGR